VTDDVRIGGPVAGDPPPGAGVESGAEGERAFVAQLQQGDPAAFEELVRRNSGHMLAVARRLLRSEEDARDAVQDAFMQAFRGLAKFEGQSRLSTWLHRIAINASLMRLRTRRRHPESPIDDLLPQFETDGHRSDPGPAWRQSSLAELEQAETRALVRERIDSLPETYRNVLILRDIEGLDTEEAATALGTTPGAVKVRLHRARQALRTLLDPHFSGDSGHEAA